MNPKYLRRQSSTGATGAQSVKPRNYHLKVVSSLSSGGRVLPWYGSLASIPSQKPSMPPSPITRVLIMVLQATMAKDAKDGKPAFGK